MRLVRIVDIEPFFGLEAPVHPDAPDPVTPVVVDRGVFPMLLPETLAGLVVLDLVETLRLDRRTAICALCLRSFAPASQQASLAGRGEPVYHPDCMPEHRRRYMRDYGAGRTGNSHPHIGSFAMTTRVPHSSANGSRSNEEFIDPSWKGQAHLRPWRPGSKDPIREYRRMTAGNGPHEQLGLASTLACPPSRGGHRRGAPSLPTAISLRGLARV